VEDGGIVKVPLYLADSGERKLSDALANALRYSGTHKPGPVSDALESMQRDSGTTVSDAVSDDLLDRRGVTLAQARQMRDAAFADLQRRSQSAWRRKSGDADPDGDNDDNNDRDPDDLEAAMEARERARLERDQRGDNAWRRTNPNAATATERQGERWRGGK
jgi:hypothetical protein